MHATPASQRRLALWCHRLRWWQPLGLMLAITVVSGGNPATPSFNFVSMDKVIHALVFGLLATSIYRLANPAWPSGLRTMLAIAITALFGLADELHQSHTPGRFMDMADWIADVFGGVLAVYVYRGWSGYRRFLELAVFPRKPKLEP